MVNKTKRTHLVGGWVTASEKAEIGALARALRLTVSELVRRLILGRELPDATRHDAVRALARINADLARLGNLLRMALADDEYEAPGGLDLESLFEKIRATQAVLRQKIEAL